MNEFYFKHQWYRHGSDWWRYDLSGLLSRHYPYNCENNSNAQQKRRAEQKLTFLGGVKSVESRSSVRGKPTQTWRHPHMLRSRAARIKPTIPLAHWSGQNALNHTPAHRYILKSLFMHIFADFPDRHRCIWNVSFDYCDGLASQKHNPADSTSWRRVIRSKHVDP